MRPVGRLDEPPRPLNSFMNSALNGLSKRAIGPSCVVDKWDCIADRWDRIVFMLDRNADTWDHFAKW